MALTYSQMLPLGTILPEFELLNVLKGGMARNRELVDQYSDDMLYYSNLERKVILSTFIFQFIIFVIIQVFELNSINFNLKKRLNEKKIY